MASLDTNTQLCLWIQRDNLSLPKEYLLNIALFFRTKIIELTSFMFQNPNVYPFFWNRLYCIKYLVSIILSHNLLMLPVAWCGLVGKWSPLEAVVKKHRVCCCWYTGSHSATNILFGSRRASIIKNGSRQRCPGSQWEERLSWGWCG